MSTQVTAALLSPKNWLDFVQFNVANPAIYCLVLFYYATCKKSKILVPAEPFWKFVAVKGLVFGTFFQDLGIEMVFYFKPELARHFGGTETKREAALGALKATLMCVEMLAFAVLHAVAFPHHQYPKVVTTDDDANPSARWLAAELRVKLAAPDDVELFEVPGGTHNGMVFAILRRSLTAISRDLAPVAEPGTAA